MIIAMLLFGLAIFGAGIAVGAAVQLIWLDKKGRIKWGHKLCE